MDMIQDWADYLLSGHANPAFQLLAPWTGPLSSTINLIQGYFRQLLEQVLNKPDLATIALLVIILFVSLKILNMLWQTVVFWLRLARSIAFWGGLAMLGMWMYSRGAEGVVEDVQYWIGVWQKDYEYWAEKERVARHLHDGRRMGGGSSGFRSQGKGAKWF